MAVIDNEARIEIRIDPTQRHKTDVAKNRFKIGFACPAFCLANSTPPNVRAISTIFNTGIAILFIKVLEMFSRLGNVSKCFIFAARAYWTRSRAKPCDWRQSTVPEFHHRSPKNASIPPGRMYWRWQRRTRPARGRLKPGRPGAYYCAGQICAIARPRKPPSSPRNPSGHRVAGSLCR